MNHWPDGFEQHLQQQPGVQFEQLLQSLEQEAVVSVRINQRKPVIRFHGLPLVPWCTHGIYLPERPVFALDPHWHAGAYYVQEASSMFLDHVVKQLFTHEPIRALDLCASPGGKSTLLCDALPSGSMLVSNEVIRSRVGTLRENITKWGHEQVVVSSADASAFAGLPSFFDLIVVDAPCSGSGLFRKDADAMDEWNPDNVALCAARQNRILDDVLPALQTGGVLVYSTCSFSEEENEAVISRLLKDHHLEIVHLEVPAEWNILHCGPEEGCFRFYPDRLQGEGFFLAVMRLRENSPADRSFRPQKLPERSTAYDEQAWTDMTGRADGCFYSWDEDTWRWPLQREHDWLQICAAVPVVQAGVLAGRQKGKDLLPGHGLAMSGLYHDEIPVIYLDEKQALKYLRREELDPALFETGWSLVGFNGAILGWVKKIPHRINNYYPMGYRLRK